MFGTYGLYGHMQRQFLKSALLLAGFSVLIVVTWYAWCIVYAALVDGWWAARMGKIHDANVLTVADIMSRGVAYAEKRWWLPWVLTASWFVVAYMIYGDMIRMATGSRPVTRIDAPKLYNLVENLAITAGLPMPRLEVIYSGSRNAFASGLSRNDACITVTSGLMRALRDDELEAVLAHELTHIKNNDVRLMVIATVFAGGLTLIGDGIARALFPPQLDPNNYDHGYGDQIIEDNYNRSGRGRAAASLMAGEGENTPAAVLVSLLFGALFLALAHVMSLLIKFAVSRSREFLADAGAIELTKNPDALIAALQKISGHDQIAGLNSNIQAMMISSPADMLFSTHPPVETRIMALQQYAGGRMIPRTERPAIVAGQPKSAPSILNPTVAIVPAGAMGFAGGRAAFGRRGTV